MNYMLGEDQTAPAGLILDIISPTDANQVAADMAELVKTYYPGNILTQELNPDLWRKLGFDAYSGPIPGWLKTVVAWERTNKTSLDKNTATAFTTQLFQNTNVYRSDDNDDYIRAWTDLDAQGRLPDTMKKPWTYTAPAGGLLSDVAGAAGKAVGSAASGMGAGVGVLLLGAVAVYAAVTVFLPKMLLKK
jgi:hypothetical protein